MYTVILSSFMITSPTLSGIPMYVYCDFSGTGLQELATDKLVSWSSKSEFIIFSPGYYDVFPCRFDHDMIRSKILLNRTSQLSTNCRNHRAWPHPLVSLIEDCCQSQLDPLELFLRDHVFQDFFFPVILVIS